MHHLSDCNRQRMLPLVRTEHRHATVLKLFPRNGLEPQGVDVHNQPVIFSTDFQHRVNLAGHHIETALGDAVAADWLSILTGDFCNCIRSLANYIDRIPVMSGDPFDYRLDLGRIGTDENGHGIASHEIGSHGSNELVHHRPELLPEDRRIEHVNRIDYALISHLLHSPRYC